MSIPLVLSKDDLDRVTRNNAIAERELTRFLHDRYLTMSSQFRIELNDYFEEMRSRLGIGDRWTPDNHGRGRLHRRTRAPGAAMVRNISILIAHLHFLFGRAVGCINFPSEALMRHISTAWRMAAQGYDHNFIAELINGLELWPTDFWPPRTRAMLTLLLEFVPPKEEKSDD